MAPPKNPLQELVDLYSSGRFSEMERRARRFHKEAPGVAAVNELLGLSLTGQRRFADALPYLVKATQRDPTEPQFLENLALCQRELNEFGQAEQNLRRALALRPNAVEATNALGSVLRSLKRMDEAKAAFERVLTLNPNHVDAHLNLGKTLTQKGEWGGAERVYRRGLALAPTRADIAISLALLLRRLERKAEAIEIAEHCLRLFGGAATRITDANVHALDSLAVVFEGADRPGRALDILKATCGFRPELRRAVYASFVARRVCDWDFAEATETAALKGMGQDAPLEGASPWWMLCFPRATASDQLAFARKIASLYAEPPRQATRQRARARSERLKIGYLSADFYDHATSHLIAGVIEAHDRDRFELVGYDLSPSREDDYRARMRAAFGNFVSMHEMPNEVATDRIVTDEIDVVIDLNGWTAGNRASVLAPRPAPVQVQWLGYAGTVGAPWIDYIIADRTLIPPEDEIFYSEKVIRLPDTYQPNDRDRIMGERGERTDHALPMDAFVFCSFNQSFKITRDVFDVWMRLLRDVPRSILWLLESNPEAMQALRAQASARGILTERLVFAPKVSSAAHRARIAHADLALDCFPYGSHTTCSDVLHAGVPLVALKGDTFASRVSASLLSAAGLTDLVTSTLADYYDMARALASDRDRLNLLRDRARGARASALFDTKRFTLKLEHALAECCRRHAEGATPASFDVP